jgi:uncharacterized phage infection (PIP) family protein YhgE
VTTDTRRPLGLRGGLRRLSVGLIAYGLIGLVVAVIGLGGLFLVSSRINTAADRADTTLGELTATMDKTATALKDASATATSFATTIDTSSTALGQAAVTIRGVGPQLHDLETQFRSINILGAQPLLRAADLMGQVATGIDGLDVKIDGVASALLDNKAALLKNADSLGALGTQMSALSVRIKSGVIQESLDDQQAVVTLLILIFVMWTAVPAIGALLLGIWLRRELGRTDDDSPASAKVVA